MTQIDRGTHIALVNPLGHVLVSRRSTRAATFPDCIQFPGGRAEPGEDRFDCAARELAEELGVASSRWIMAYSKVFNPPARLPYELTAFVIPWREMFWSRPNPEPDKCSDWYWADPAWLQGRSDLIDGVKETMEWLERTKVWE
jgi:8-oxo-dGTP pyrophosphatase MutT (NUDIX family)